MREWGSFEKFKKINDNLPPVGDGDSRGTQASTAICKLVYRYYNDGDIYDNTYSLSGAGDIICTGCANWLWQYIDGADVILDKIKKLHLNDGDGYAEILYKVAELVESQMDELLTKEKVGDAYMGDGPYKIGCYNCGEGLDYWEYDKYDGLCEDCYYDDGYDEDDY